MGIIVAGIIFCGSHFLWESLLWESFFVGIVFCGNHVLWESVFVGIIVVALFSLGHCGDSWNMMGVTNGTLMEYVGISRNLVKHHGI